MEKRNVPRLRFPGFPEVLQKKKMADEIKDSGYGPRFNSNDYSVNGNVRTIRGTDISLDGEILYSQVPLALLQKDMVDNHKLEDGDLVMITTADCGLTGVYRKQDISYIPSAYAVKLRLKATSDPYYFKYLFQTKIAKDQVNRFIRKATVANLPGSDILKFEFNLPNLLEQNKVSKFLASIEEKAIFFNKKKALLEKYKKGMMQKIFNQEIRFKDEEGKDFGNWEEKLGGELFENISNKEHKSELPILAITQEFGAIPRDMIDYNVLVSEKSVNSYKVVDVGDFIISLRSFQGGIEYSNYLGICSPAYIILRLKHNYNKKYFKYYLKTPEYIQLLNSNLEGIRDGKMISYKYFSDYPIRFPSSRAEQDKIVDFISAIDDKIKLVTVQIENMEKFKKGLLGEMFV
jgi:type I restriction enzyme S subunit